MICTNGFYPDTRIYNEAKTLIESGYDIEVLCWDRESYYKDKEYEEVDGFQVKRFFGYTKFGTGYKQLFGYMKFIYQIKEYLKDKPYDIVHGHDIDGAFAGVFISKNRKLIWDMREFFDGFNYNTIRSLIYKNIAKLLFKKCDGIIFVVDYQGQRYKELIRKNTICETILNATESAIFEGFKRKPSSKLRISYIGTVRHFRELKILMDVGEQFENVQININGGGAELDNIRHISNRYRHTLITGVFDYRETKKFYEDADIIYVVYDKNLPNVKHAFPIKGLEAIHTSTPIIANTDVYFGDFVKENDIGFTVEGDDQEELRSLVGKIIGKRELLEEKRKNIERIKHLYTWDVQKEKLKKFYNKILTIEK